MFINGDESLFSVKLEKKLVKQPNETLRFHEKVWVISNEK